MLTQKVKVSAFGEAALAPV